LSDGGGDAAAADFLAGGVAFDHDGDRDLGIFDGSEADEPGEVEGAFAGADLGGAGFSGDAKVGDFFDLEALGGAAERAFLHGLEHRGVLLRGDAERLGALAGAVGIVEERGRGVEFAAGEGGGDAGHLERGDGEEALADGGVGGVAGIPALAVDFPFPLHVADDHAAGLEGELDAGRAVEAEAAGFGGDGLDAGVHAVFIIKYVAAHRERVGESHVAVAASAVARHEAILADAEVAGAFDFGIDGDGALAEAGERGDELEGGAGRVEALDGAVEPGAARFDFGERRAGDHRRGVVEVVVGFAGEGEDLAGADIEGDGGAGVFGDVDGFFGGDLEVDIERGGDALALDGEAFLERGIDAVAGGIDAEDGAAGLALEFAVEGRFEAGFADAALHLEGGEVFAGDVFVVDVGVDADVAERVGGGGAVGVVAGAGRVDLKG
jgi:hypothetical protein